MHTFERAAPVREYPDRIIKCSKQIPDNPQRRFLPACSHDLPANDLFEPGQAEAAGARQVPGVAVADYPQRRHPGLGLERLAGGLQRGRPHTFQQHPLPSTTYQILDANSATVNATDQSSQQVTVAPPGPFADERLWRLSSSRRGYTISTFSNSGTYAGALTTKEGSVVSLDDQPFEWLIEQAGQGVFKISVPDRDLAWTEAAIWGQKVVTLSPYKSGSPTQLWRIERFPGE
ncbi:hypothetical protein F5544_04280 [Nocardia arthritidis]|uniref:Ricin B lectin domain-containing protein n=1 Tax=Nocardia arthritidis TaxID=228602 RepID=A0A6G9Y6P2_9NOCA|nr:hypothetical protein F5544_04280 [Nocardia arthritidis]